ncbi:MAG TPA: acyl-CoA dehydrogenase [Dehalococcoidia bacterium]|nr:acyl-CoA dehydrogenase [Dehalococcoidia bacterium]
MDFKDYSTAERDTPEQAKFRQEVRDFLDKEVTAELRREAEVNFFIPPGVIAFMRTLGAKGWLMPEWPKEYGGAGLSSAEKSILTEEAAAYGIRLGSPTDIVGPIVMRYGTEEQKKEWLPKIASGEAIFAIGYTEPNAGTDLAALEMRAIPDGDDYIVNGQKIFSTGAYQSTHHLLAVRTNVDVPKHRGISLFIADLRTPGITISPQWTIADERTDAVFYDDVRVPKKNRLGEENAGWLIITDALTVEREVVSYGHVDARVVVDKLIQYAKETKHNGKPLTEDPLVRQTLAQLAIEANIFRLFTHRLNWLITKGTLSDWAAAMVKIWSAELTQRAANAGMQIMGLYGQLEPDSKWAPLEGYIELVYRFSVVMSFGGGSNELMRSLMAIKGMGLPREPRI